MSLVSALARYATLRTRPPQGAACELCAAPFGERHRHVVELERRAVRCACDTCARLFAEPGAGARFRTIPERVLADPRGPSASEWAALGVPVRIAFLFRSSRTGRWTAALPGPAGTTEAELDDARWAALAATLPLARQVEPDVEALLFHADRGGARVECLLAPIDACYALSGRLRRAWKGFDGGAEAAARIDEALAELRARARTSGGAWEGGR